MDNTTEVIRHQMDETRSSLQEKLETLEEQVKSTVQEATDTVATVKDTVASVKESVQETVDSVKESVQGTVESVKETFNIERQMREHPWAFFAGATALGFVGGRLLGRLGGTETERSDYEAVSSSSRSRFGASFTPTATGPGYGASPTARAEGNGYGQRRQSTTTAPEPAAEASEGGGWLSGFLGQFSGEFDKLKGLAIGAVGGIVRDLVVSAAPPAIASRIKEVVDNVTEKLGGQHVEGPILNPDSSTSHQGEGREERYEAKMGRPLGAAQG